MIKKKLQTAGIRQGGKRMDKKKIIFTALGLIFAAGAIFFAGSVFGKLMRQEDGVLSSILLTAGCICFCAFFFTRNSSGK